MILTWSRGSDGAHQSPLLAMVSPGTSFEHVFVLEKFSPCQLKKRLK